MHTDSIHLNPDSHCSPFALFHCFFIKYAIILTVLAKHNALFETTDDVGTIMQTVFTLNKNSLEFKWNQKQLGLSKAFIIILIKTDILFSKWKCSSAFLLYRAYCAGISRQVIGFCYENSLFLTTHHIIINRYKYDSTLNMLLHGNWCSS